MRIAYMSDLHLEFHRDGGESFIDSLGLPDCDLLVIAGDLAVVDNSGIYRQVSHLCNIAPKVLWVAGNHEYFGASINSIDAKMKHIQEQNGNLIIANTAKTFQVNGVNILAGTMWFPDAADNYLYKHFMNDFRYISDLEMEVYHRNKAFDIRLHAIEDDPFVVVTHHLPSYQSVHPRFRRSELNRFFVGGEYEELIANSQIKCWIHGHSHEAVDYRIGKTSVVSNPAGYPNEIKAYWQVKYIDI